MSDPSKRRWIVDGMNVIGSRPDGWWNDRDGAVRRMVETLGDFIRRSGDDVTVVFDHRPWDLESGDHDGVHVAFARRHGRNAADDEIVQMVTHVDDPSAFRVVTSDSTLAERVRELGARVVSSGSFLRHVSEG